jgi:flagellar hook-associated protein 2
LSVNSAKLDNALNGKIDGVTLDDVRRLFSLDGQSTNGNIDFILANRDTKETTTGYQVDITAAAERAEITATNSLAASTVVDNSNDTLTITIDGTLSGSLTLSAGTYTQQQLADHLEAVINANQELAGRSVSVTLDGDRLKIASALYGGSSEVTIGGGTALGTLGFTGSETNLGQDVAGKFIVDGVDEGATGTGRLLVGNEGNANTAGLQVGVSLTSSQVQAGSDATLTVTRGLASRLDLTLRSLLDPITGRVKTVNDGFTREVDEIQKTIDRQTELFELRQQNLIEQFVALESAIGELQSVGNSLAVQLSGLIALQNRTA